MEERDLPHFRSIPWCMSILSGPAFIITPTFSRQFKANTEDSLFATTFQTPSTISHCLSLHSHPLPDSQWIPEVRSLMTLGLGMNGGPAMLHGGVIATLMDDVIGTLLTVNKNHSTGDPLSVNTVTAYMNVKYLRPIATPQTVLVIAKSRGTLDAKRKKFLMDAEIRDGEGTVLAKADSLWIRMVKK
ncbi:thioesterase superfamily protein, partial [Mollisia scopiformis]